MKNIIKIVIVMLTSVSLFTSAIAGEMTVTGTAKATYNITSGYATGSKGLGVANELNFAASGELDNGWSWNYLVALDPGNTATNALTSNVENDDTYLTLTTNIGTIGVFSMAGGLSVQDAASKSVYARPTDIGDPSSTTDNPNIDGYNNIQFHTPTLPFGTVIKVGYAPGLDATQNSSNATGVVGTKSVTYAGDSATMYQVSSDLGGLVPGVKVQADYISFAGGGNGTAADFKQQAEAGSVALTYSNGPIAIGYSEARYAPMISIAATATAGTVEWYDQTNYSIAYAVNDSLSLSYEMEKSATNKVSTTDTEVTQESSAIQAAYTMGGMTMAVSVGSYDNNGYTQGQNANQALFAVTMAF
jgi:hypothetical protein